MERRRVGVYLSVDKAQRKLDRVNVPEGQAEPSIYKKLQFDEQSMLQQKHSKLDRIKSITVERDDYQSFDDSKIDCLNKNSSAH